MVVIARGIVISLLYLTATQIEDTTPEKVFLFSLFYVIIFNCASLVGINPEVVTTAFITKTIFTLIDERIKKTPKDAKITRTEK